MIVDANVLIYALGAPGAKQEPARAWLGDALNGDERVGLPWVSLLAFQRVTTNARIMKRPLSVDQAWGAIQTLISSDQVWIPEPGPRHAEILGRILRTSGATGNLVTDAHLAALAIEHGTEICSFDADFARFPDVRWFNPLHGNAGA
ncbi:TA system VapC family ribonuclease toxin [Corynebacterium meitnerae]|uniref:Ribonuclease VapC n=1 Tax=Corynebacterium meitnerae TaxID=2913498 RepID=A0A9X3RKE1_9CORY|nr:TA system VapC family ribonuclease toxin [Corynebacterium meitnerae]MCZ9293797.1 PIN domain-containing protein [Corynebacterium meitnerae]